MTRPTGSAWWAGLVAALALVAPGCRVPGAESMFFARSEHPDPAAADCERCHQEVYREWLGSGHARAFTSEAFRQASSGGRAGSCLGCHAPAPVDDERPVAARAARRAEGVTCLSCHLSTEPGAPPLAMRGPASRTSPIEIHPIIAEDPFYRSSALCGRCHEPELAQWRAAAEAAPEPVRTCQECHMPAVRRKVESVHDEHGYSAIFVALGREQDLRRHDFAVPDTAGADEGIRLEVAPRPGGVRVRVENRLPHALPTGAFGRREVRLVVAWPGGRQAHPLASAREGALAAGEARDVFVRLPAAATTSDLHVHLERWDRAGEAWTMLTKWDRPQRRGTSPSSVARAPR